MAILKHPEKDAVQFARGRPVDDLQSLQGHLAHCQECSELVLFVQKINNLLKAAQAGQPKRPDVDQELEAVGLDRIKASELLERFALDQLRREAHPNVDNRTLRTLLEVDDVPEGRKKICLKVLDVHSMPLDSLGSPILKIEKTFGKTAWAVPGLYVRRFTKLYGRDLQRLVGHKLWLDVKVGVYPQTGRIRRFVLRTSSKKKSRKKAINSNG